MHGEFYENDVAGPRDPWRIARCSSSALLLVLGAIDAALGAAVRHAAQLRRRRSSAPFIGWILEKQAEFYRMLSGTIRAAKADGSAAWTLMGISFVYGIFHAAGPGHGKAVISSYLVANNETWRRGIALSFASAVLQALTAIVIVGIAAVLLGATAHVMGNTVRVIEMVSYALIILIGLRLLWVKGRAFLHLLRPAERRASRTTTMRITRTAIIMATRTGMAIHTITTTTIDHDHDEDEAHAWGHAHAPEPSELDRHALAAARARRRSSRWVCGPARAPSSCWCSRWRRGCSGSASPRPS